MPDPGARMPEPGPISRNLVLSVEQLRQARGLSLRKLSARLGELGRPIPPLGLSRIQRGERRVDVDELVALALVLDVAPSSLLLPRDAPGGTLIDLTPEVRQRAADAWQWADGAAPLPGPPDGTSRARLTDFQRHARPGGGTEEHDAISEARKLVSRMEDLVAARDDPEAARDAGQALDRALRRVQLEAEEFLAGVRGDAGQQGRQSA